MPRRSPGDASVAGPGVTGLLPAKSGSGIRVQSQFGQIITNSPTTRAKVQVSRQYFLLRSVLMIPKPNAIMQLCLVIH